MTKQAPRAPRVLDEDAAVEYCGSSASTFQKLRMRGGGPAYVKMGRRVVYRIEDLEAWLASQVVMKPKKKVRA